MQVKLYTTAGCHLCDEARQLLERVKATGRDISICEVEIADSEWLLEKYGIRIPVVTADNDARELGWPFSYEDLAQFIA